jgi:hypothetical protein
MTMMRGRISRERGAQVTVGLGERSHLPTDDHGLMTTPQRWTCDFYHRFAEASIELVTLRKRGPSHARRTPQTGCRSRDQVRRPGRLEEKTCSPPSGS